MRALCRGVNAGDWCATLRARTGLQPCAVACSCRFEGDAETFQSSSCGVLCSLRQERIWAYACLRGICSRGRCFCLFCGVACSRTCPSSCVPVTLVSPWRRLQCYRSFCTARVYDGECQKEKGNQIWVQVQLMTWRRLQFSPERPYENPNVHAQKCLGSRQGWLG